MERHNPREFDISYNCLQSIHGRRGDLLIARYKNDVLCICTERYMARLKNARMFCDYSRSVNDVGYIIVIKNGKLELEGLRGSIYTYMLYNFGPEMNQKLVDYELCQRFVLVNEFSEPKNIEDEK